MRLGYYDGALAIHGLPVSDGKVHDPGDLEHGEDPDPEVTQADGGQLGVLDGQRRRQILAVLPQAGRYSPGRHCPRRRSRQSARMTQQS